MKFYMLISQKRINSNANDTFAPNRLAVTTYKKNFSHIRLYYGRGYHIARVRHEFHFEEINAFPAM
jgi:hypothetical protein